jgi:O-succinylbenzoic acid--CoA ligase
MIPNYKTVHNQFKLNSRHYTFDTLKQVAYSFIKEGVPYEKEIGDFLLNWLDASDSLIVKTSGSTGKPKSIALSKQAMVHSAIATGDYFKLNPDDTALLCLPISYIAGKMMFIRALVLGLHIDLVVPNSSPLDNLTREYDFVAMVPMQLENSLKSISKIKTLIVGGAKVSKNIIEQIKTRRTKVFETYGMTETITHIAVKKLNHAPSEAYFEVLPNIQISQDDRGCLIIQVPYLKKRHIVTNDIVKLHSDTSFEWLGRIDNVINSGGIKIHPEQLEARLMPFIHSDFFIASQDNISLGEEIFLVIESDEQTLAKDSFKKFKKHEIPKAILFVNPFIRTTSGKINRAKTLASVKKTS